MTFSLRTSTQGWISGFVGVAIFSASLVATRVAVADFDPVFLTVARASIAAILGGVLLAFHGIKPPAAHLLLPLALVALGVVVGFPLLTALALQTVTSAHSIVFIGVLPLATAIFGVLRGGEKPAPAFWLFSCLGSACVVGFALFENVGGLALGDIYMFAAIVVCGLGYAEGGKLSRTLGGWQVISWALLLSLPVMLLLVVIYWPENLAAVQLPAWLGLGYVSVFSMLIGFVFWYRGLALGGIAAVGQLQLLQPFMGLGLAALILAEPVNVHMLLATMAVVVCVAASRRYGQKAK